MILAFISGLVILGVFTIVVTFVLLIVADHQRMKHPVDE